MTSEAAWLRGWRMREFPFKDLLAKKAKDMLRFFAFKKEFFKDARCSHSLDLNFRALSNNTLEIL